MDLFVIRNGSPTGLRYRDHILDPIERPYAEALGDYFVLNARPQRARVVIE